MSGITKKVIIGSLGAAGIVALIALVDLAIALPFGRKMMWDVLLLVSAGCVIYMAYDAYQDLK